MKSFNQHKYLELKGDVLWRHHVSPKISQIKAVAFTIVLDEKTVK